MSEKSTFTATHLALSYTGADLAQLCLTWRVNQVRQEFASPLRHGYPSMSSFTDGVLVLSR